MKFKTTIKLITEADNKNEAMEIAGEFLSGNLTSGVDMEFRTVPVCNNKERIGVTLIVVLIVGLLVVPMLQIRQSQNLTQIFPGQSAIQPPLNTRPIDKERADFKKEWQTKQAQEMLKYIKNK